MNADLPTLTSLAERSGRSRAWIAPAVALSAALVFVLENRHTTAPIDDAYIVYRYAENLAHGNGFVFNVGERVEGVTTLLWTLLVAAFVRAGLDAERVAHALSVAFGGLTLWLTYVYARAALPSEHRITAAVAPWLLVACPSFIVWSTAGLETPLFMATVMATLYAEARGRPALSMAMAAVATLVRPDGALLALVVAACTLGVRPRERARTALLSLCYALFLGLLTAFRLAYFGSPLPNTFYAKVGGVAWWWGPHYLGRFAVQLLLPMLAPSAFAVKDRYFLGGLGFALATTVYVAAVGGDVFNHSRFFMPVLPVLCATTVSGARRAAGRGTWLGRFAALGVEVSFVWLVFGTIAGLGALVLAATAAWGLGRRWGAAVVSVGSVLVLVGVFELRRLSDVANAAPSSAAVSVAWPFTMDTRWAELQKTRAAFEYSKAVSVRAAALLDARPPKDKLVASIAIGGLGYFSSARILDLVGLVDHNIATTPQRASPGTTLLVPGHQRTNSKYVLSRNPDFVLIAKVGTDTFPAPAIIELWQSKEFRDRYVWDPAMLWYQRKPLRAKAAR